MPDLIVPYVGELCGLWVCVEAWIHSMHCSLDYFICRTILSAAIGVLCGPIALCRRQTSFTIMQQLVRTAQCSNK